MFHKVKKLHFIGIGGIGMSGIAELLNNLGYEVSGSDISESDTTDKLRKIGIRVEIGHAADNLVDAEVVVYSSAVPETNPEIEEARSRKIPIIPRAEMLNELMRLKTGIAISGTHGKTSTTSMVAEILAEADLDPTYVIGGKLNSIDSNAKLGKGEYIVFEACEAFGSFLYFSPIMLVVLNIDEDHLEYYQSMEGLRNAFLSVINKVPFYGTAIVNNDDENVKLIIEKTTKRIVTFGLDNDSDYMAANIKCENWKSKFDVIKKDKKLGTIELNLPGRHNVSNALAALTVSMELDTSFNAAKKALSKFINADRRFQIVGQANDITVVDDYAHHPAEIKATLKGAKENTDKRIIAVFQPHLFSRTKALYKDFAESLQIADHVFVTDIYPAREKPIPGVKSELISDTMKKNGYDKFELIRDMNDIPERLNQINKSGDCVIFLGAGDIWKMAEKYLKMLKKIEEKEVEYA